MKISIYIRQESGTIEYRGVETWDSLDQFLSANWWLLDEKPVCSEMMGWPDASVWWYGNTGIAVSGKETI